MFEVKLMITITTTGEQPRTLSEVRMRANNKCLAYAFADHLAKGSVSLFRKLMDATTKKLADLNKTEETATAG